MTPHDHLAVSVEYTNKYNRDYKFGYVYLAMQFYFCFSVYLQWLDGI